LHPDVVFLGLQSTSSLGWLWLVPSFHIPSLASASSSADSTSSSSTATSPRTHTLTFPREIVDFRSKTLRSISLVFEELHAPSPSPTPSPAAGSERRGSVGKAKGEKVPDDAQRHKAEEGGLEGAEGGTEYK
jgi:hypothetical protein